MPPEILNKKLDQMRELIGQLHELLTQPLERFMNEFMVTRAAERNWQLIVELASDINTSLLLDAGKPAPSSYRQSFLDVATLGIIDHDLADALGQGARLRNVLVHEYDFREDIEQFYNSAKMLLPQYEHYVKVIFQYASQK